MLTFRNYKFKMAFCFVIIMCTTTGFVSLSARSFDLKVEFGIDYMRRLALTWWIVVFTIYWLQYTLKGEKHELLKLHFDMN